jgi:hypothetical protein
MIAKTDVASFVRRRMCSPAYRCFNRPCPSETANLDVNHVSHGFALEFETVISHILRGYWDS